VAAAAGGQVGRVTMSRDSAGARTWDAVIAAGLDAPADARRWARWLADVLDPGRLDDAMLVLSELVTNSVLHSGLSAGAPIHLSGRVTGDRVRIGVCDCGCGFDLAGVPELPHEASPGGRGLWIVNRLADRLLVDGARGRVVFEMGRGATPAAPVN
jgi:anti-sigma regulatory factor (Ser/Thr protein kinase)